MPSPPATSLNPFRVLVRHRNFRIFWTGQTLSLVGTWMQQMASGWLALELTDDPLLVGLVASIGSLPVLLFSLHGGVLADRHDKLRLVTIAQSLLIVEALALWWFTWTGHITIEVLLVLSFFAGCVSSVEIPSRQALIVELVGREELHEAIALNSSGFNLARIVGPAIGAVVISALGLAWCYALNAASYLTVLAGLFMIRLPAFVPQAHATSPFEGIRQLFVYVRSTPAIAALMQMVVVFSVLGVSYLTLMPVVARDVLHTEAGGYGLLLSCVGLGGLAGALFLAAALPRVRRGRLLAVTAWAHPAVLILFSLARSEWLAAPILLVAGFTMIVNNALTNGLLQSIVPNEMRGRLMSAYSLVVVGLSQVVGAFVAGAVARALGADLAIAIAAGLMLLYGLTVVARREEVRSL